MLIKEIEETTRPKVKAVKIETSKEAEFKINSILPQLKRLLNWLIQNNFEKALEIVTICICRRRKKFKTRKVELKIKELDS